MKKSKQKIEMKGRLKNSSNVNKNVLESFYYLSQYNS